MPKRKKQKTHHHSHHHNATTNASSRNGQLSHEEIWDDSALVRSWNDAVAEYEYYHSIHARGEDVDEVLRRAEAEAAEEDGEGGTGEGAAINGSTNQRAKVVDVKAVIDNDCRIAGDIVDRVAEGVGDGGGGEESADEGEIEDDDDDNGVNTVKRLVDTSQGNAAEEVHSAAVDEQPRERPAQLLGPELPPAQTHGSTAATGQTVVVSADQTLENIKMAYYWAGYYSGLYDGQRQAQTQTGAQNQEKR